MDKDRIMSEIKSLEHQTLKVPYEVLNKKFRLAQKTLDRELNQIQNATAELEKDLHRIKTGELNRLIGGVVERLQVLKRKADESISDELAAGYVCKRRLDHLRDSLPIPLAEKLYQMSSSVTSSEAIAAATTTGSQSPDGQATTPPPTQPIGTAPDPLNHPTHNNDDDPSNVEMGGVDAASAASAAVSVNAILANNALALLNQHKSEELSTVEIERASLMKWKRIRLDRLIVEHFLRLGYYESAECLADRSNIRDLTNLEIFQTSREVEQDLEHHNTAKCIAWCLDNKSKLRKINSKIEFQLRVQEFIELVRETRKLEAVKHAQKYFPSFEREQLTEIKQAMALLAFAPTTLLEPYRSLFNPARWRDLILKFRLENYRLYQLSQQSILSVAVQAGLSSLKTPQCYSVQERNQNCPVCQDDLNKIATDLPFSHCAQSRLICRITGKALNEDNLPMMLPNGQIFGESALSHISKEGGIIVCPQTSERFTQPKIEKVFVM